MALGIASVPLAIAMLAAMAGTAEGSWPSPSCSCWQASAFLGAVIDGLLLGHWYLTDRGLTRTPINRIDPFLLFVGVGLETAALLVGGFAPTAEASSQFNPLLTSAGLAAVDRARDGGATALIAVMIRATLRGTRSSAVQAATGFFYLAVITALTAEFAAKVTVPPVGHGHRPSWSWACSRRSSRGRS